MAPDRERLGVILPIPNDQLSPAQRGGHIITFLTRQTLMTCLLSRSIRNKEARNFVYIESGEIWIEWDQCHTSLEKSELRGILLSGVDAYFDFNE